MSYCRFSSDGYQCDVYAYESEMGYEVHVATMKCVFTNAIPECDDVTDVAKLTAWHQAVSRAVESAAHVPIQSEYAGASETFGTPHDAADYLETIRKTGIRVPQYAIDELRDEDD